MLPFNHVVGFRVINLTSLFLTAVLFYYYLKKLNFSQIHSFIGVSLFLLSPTVIFSMYDVVLVFLSISNREISNLTPIIVKTPVINERILAK